jgi:enoyl-CoA hydratase/carnithine racemase
MSDFNTIIYEKQGAKAFITLNRPQKLNVYNIQMRDELHEALLSIRDDDEICVAVLKGSGEKAFCAGADLSEFLTAPPPVAARQARFERDVWGLFLSIDKPVIAALHGYVLGSGIEMAMCCDIRIATEDAQFGVPEMGLGIIPAAGGSQTIPRVIDKGVALDMLISGRWMKAEEALRRKMVNKIVPRGELLNVANKMADRICGFETFAVRSIKQAVMRGLDLPLPQALELETRLSHALTVR